MSGRRKRITALLAVAGCIITLLQGAEADANVAGKSISSMESGKASDRRQSIRKNSGVFDVNKAEYLGLGRLYPFVAADGTGMLYYFTTSTNRAYYQVKALVTAGVELHAEIYDEPGNLIAETKLGDREYQRFMLTPETKYFLKLSGSNELTGEVLVSEVADDYSGEISGAQEIAFNKEHVVTTDCSGDVDYLKFTTSAQDVTYTLTIDSTAGVAGTYELLNEAGETIEEAGGVTDVENTLTAKLLLEPEKTYYFKFSSTESYCQVLLSVAETINTYALTYHLDGGKNNKENPASYLATDKFTLKAPTKAGYLFEGWFSFADFTGEFTGVDGQGKRNYELYAKWRKAEPATAAIKSFVSKSVGKAQLEIEPVAECDGYQISITRTVDKQKVVKTQTTKNTTISFKKWSQGKKYSVKVRAYIIDSCGKRVYGAYSKTESVTVKKKVVKKSKKKK